MANGPNGLHPWQRDWLEDRQRDWLEDRQIQAHRMKPIVYTCPTGKCDDNEWVTLKGIVVHLRTGHKWNVYAIWRWAIRTGELDV